MKLIELIQKNRSYRRFDASIEIPKEKLFSWINLARLSPSAKNIQSLRYIVINDKHSRKEIFPLLTWAGYLKEWNGPKENEQPTAYIIILNDNELNTNYYCDDGIASQSILLGATNDGFGGCIVAAIQKEKLRTLLQIKNKYKIIHLIALGKPIEEVVIDEISDNKDIKYWRDAEQKHHVPKRDLNDLIINII
jgi:nitroreductase